MPGYKLTPAELDDLLAWVQSWVGSSLAISADAQRMGKAVGARRFPPPEAALRTPFGERMLQTHAALTELKARRMTVVEDEGRLGVKG